MGDREICENVYVAPIDNDMLLGKDLMTKYSAYINIPDMYIKIGGQLFIWLVRKHILHGIQGFGL
ncbi:hypothetical protein DPMN_035675 [Dreissena polymorpha]|uniref:Uncharacterized protein n=1 Tax=Dreissena polymorpha TaxID=45954 RepID=A0A9D4RL84_DREPO|nr:hypothetical protein DPMN_035675 [Dreissena polymorpha]